MRSFLLTLVLNLLSVAVALPQSLVGERPVSYFVSSFGSSLGAY